MQREVKSWKEAGRTVAPGPSVEDRSGVLGSQAGFLSLGSSYSPQPSQRRRPTPVVSTRLSSPITVTGARRNRTAFPLHPEIERVWNPDNTKSEQGPSRRSREESQRVF